MAFTREEMVAYEKGEAPAVTPPAATETVTPPDTTKQAATEESSSTVETDPAASGVDDPSVDDKAASTPAAAGDSDSVTDPDAGGGESERHVPYDRFSDVVAERNAIRKYAEHLQKVNEQLLAAGKPPVTDTAAAPLAAPKADPRPSLEQFNGDYEAFAQAQNDWLDRQVEKRVETAVEKRLAKERDTAAAQQAKDAETRALASFQEQTTKARKAHTDFDAVLSNPDLPKFATEVAREIVFSEVGAELSYYLGTHPDVATRISRLPTQEAQKAALHRLEGRLEVEAAAPAAKTPAATTTTKAKPKAPTQAPKPPTPVPPGSGAVTKTMDQMSMDEFVAHERAKAVADREARRKMVRAYRG